MKKYFYLTWQQVVDSGLLAPERLDELEKLSAERFDQLFDKEGKLVWNLSIYWIMENGEKKHFLVHAHSGALENAKREVLTDLLTEDECELLNREWDTKRRQKEEAEKFEEAEKIEAKDWNGGVFCEDRYLYSVEEVSEYYADNWDQDEEGCPVPISCRSPKYVWAAKSEQVIPHIYLDNILGNFMDNNGWEDMQIDDLNGVEELRAAVDKFVEANSPVVSYWPDYKKAILL